MRPLLILLSLLLFTSGCQSSSTAGQASSTSNGTQFVSSPGQVSEPPSSGSLTLLFDLVGGIRARIPESAATFEIQVFSSNGQLLREARVTRTQEVQLNNIPHGRLLVRVEFIGSDQQPIGYWEKFVSFDVATFVLSFTTLTPGSAPSQIPNFPSDTAQPETLALLEQPPTINPGQLFSVSFAITGAGGQILDFDGSTFSLDTMDGELGGLIEVAARDGIVTFENLTVTGDGPFTFTVSGQVNGQTLTGRSLPLARDPSTPPPNLGVPARLVWEQEPETAQARRLLRPVPSLRVVDVYGNPVSQGTFLITLSLEPTQGQMSTALEGELTQSTTGGLAVFRSLSVDQAGEYHLVASASGLLSARSSLFTVTPEQLSGQSGRMQFAAALTGETGPYASFNTVTCADLDGDGHVDISAVNSGFNTSPGEQAFLYGYGDGTFEPVNPTQSYPNWRSQVLQDLNGDGLPEILGTSSAQGGSLVLVENLGSRTFGPPIILPASPEPVDVGAFQLFGDHKLEIVVVNRQSDSVTIFELQVEPSLGATVNQTIALPPNCRPTAVVASDFDQDGDLDLAVLTEQNGKIFFLENEAGIIQAPQANDPRTLVSGKVSSRLLATDLNGDGRQDLVVLHPADDEFEVFLSEGHFQFQEPVDFEVPGNPETLAAVDVDGDGRTDLVSAGHQAEELTVWLNYGELSRWSRRSVPVQKGSLSLCSGDLDGDGSEDLVISLQGHDLMQLMFNRGNGEFAALQSFQTTTDLLYPTLFRGQFDQGPGFDIIVADENEILMYPDGDLRAGQGVSSEIFGSIGYYTRVIDVDNDGLDDLVDIYPGSASAQLTVYRNQGGGRFSQQAASLLSFQPGLVIQVADFNSDQRDDILVAGKVGNTTAQLLLSQGDGTFVEAGGVAVPSSARAADLDGDQVTDIFYGDFNGGDPKTRWLRGNGDGTFGPEQTLGISAAASLSGDFDNDGKEDLAQLLSGSRLRVYRNLGNAVFAPPVDSGQSVFSGYTQGLRTLDLDGDGDLDIVGEFGDPGSVSTIAGFLVFENLGDLQFSSARLYRGEGLSNSSIFADFDSDLDLDYIGIRESKIFVNEQY